MTHGQLPPRTSSLVADRERQQPQLTTPHDKATGPIPGPGSGSDIPRPKSTQPKQVETPKASSETLSDKATAAFIRRTLCAQHALSGPGEKGRSTPGPVDELLPPLTSSNEVDLQLYAILAVILKEFVYVWYSKITPDHNFVDEVIQTIAHCTRALEQRVRRADLESILLDELPQLIDGHIKAFRVAHEYVYPQPLAHTPREIYHILVPHPALSPVPRDGDPSTILEQARNEEAWRQLLVQGILAVLLPTDDLENGCLRALVAEIFSDMVIGNGVSQKACEPWQLWDAITTIIEALQPRKLKAVEKPTLAASQLEQFGLLSGESEGQEQGLDEIKRPGSAASASFSASGMFWTIVQSVFLAFTAARTVIYFLTTSSSLPSRSKTWPVVQSPAQASTLETSSIALPSGDQQPILSMSVWTMVGRTINLDLRMPWLSGLFSLSHHLAMNGLGRVGAKDGALDRWLSSKVQEHLLNPAYVPRLLKIVRATLFPNNAPGPPRKIPDAADIVAIKLRCAETIVGAVPVAVLRRYFDIRNVGDAGKEQLITEVEKLLNVLGDVYLNRHLVFSLIELIVVRLVPEMGEKGVGELMKERVGEELM